MKTTKVWGLTEAITMGGPIEFHRIEPLAGGVCSKHRHRSKWNGFYVESGRLLIRRWDDTGSAAETILNAGQSAKVPPGVFHQFECLESGVAFELYWSELMPIDIDRETEGFRR